MNSARVPLARRDLLLAGLCAAGGVSSSRAASGSKGIAILLADLRNPFFARVAHAFERSFSPAQTLRILSAGFDAERQASQLTAQLDGSIGLIVVTPIDAKSLSPHVAAARKAGVKVIAVDSRVEGADLVITTDNVAAGEMACKFLVDRMKGRGRLAIVDGPSNTADLDRLEGCNRVLRSHPGVEVVARTSNAGGAREGGLERMVAVMAANPRLDGVFAINDLTALGAEQAARLAGRREMLIASVDGSPAVVDRLKDSASLIAASSSQDPERMGVLAARGAVSLLRGMPPASPQLLLEPTLVTRENVAGYRGW